MRPAACSCGTGWRQQQQQCRGARPPCLLRPAARRLVTVAAAGAKQRRTQQLTTTPAPDVSSSASSGSSSSGPAAAQPDAAPARQPAEPAAGEPAPAVPARTQQPVGGWQRSLWRGLIRELSSLPRAIGIMALIAGLSGLGTVIPQNKEFEYYVTNYPAEGASKVLGFLDYNLLLGLQLDHIYTAWYFYGAIGLLAASLMACTYSTQWPTAKVAQRWRFAGSADELRKRGEPQVLLNAALRDVGSALASKSYQVFLQGGQLYAFKGLAGRLGPIGVHVALLLCLAGTAYSGFGSWKGSALVPEGQEFIVADALAPVTALAPPPGGARAVLTVNEFAIDTRPDGSVAQFYSDLSLRDFSGAPLLRKRISVNDPFRYGGVTMYQTDWALAALTLRLVEAPPPAGGGAAAPDGAAARAGDLLTQLQAEAQEQQQQQQDKLQQPQQPPPPQQQQQQQQQAQPSRASGLPQRSFNLPLASLEGKPGVPKGAKLFATFLPLELPPEDGRPPRGISMLARDLDTVTFYDSKGEFVGVRRAGSGKPITVEGLGIVLEDIIGSTGLEIKSDPGVPLVYAGFGGLMITTLISYVSHSQVWALQQGSSVVVVGRSNRSKVLFEQELNGLLDAVPEAPARAPAAGAGAGGQLQE